ncbi:PREDICTED: mechanosensitive ion channel protein 6-like [Tarenaya hassleriana]|uniref:mechanosensitive ion channel protein 6-like n=1 Tax=Tarenaya hassleriana TaxID=28532 RepID=UPI00053C2C47|nr:PREDICTED: mechanosensitive ion channel protein 6-like [Tarenaya hassleriana]
MAVDSPDRRDFVVKIDGEDERNNGGAGGTVGRIWRDGSYDFWTDGHGNWRNGGNAADDGGRDAAEQDEGFDFRLNRNGGAEDPPTKLIGQFLHKQKASGEFSLDMDLGMAELQPRGLTPVSESPASATAKKDSDALRRRNSRSSTNDDGEVVKCSSNASFQRISSNLLKTRTRSRLLDPPTPPQHPAETKSGRVPRSGLLKSGFFVRTPKTPGEEEEEEDPFSDEDVPEEYKKEKLSFWVLLEWVSLVLITAALVCSLAFPFLRKKKLWKLELWKWEVLALVLICGRLVAGWIVRILVFFVERNFLLRKRVLYFVYGIRKAVENSLWLGLVLLAWHFLFSKKVARETNSEVAQYVTRIIFCLLTGFVLWLVKTLLVKVLASSFHLSTYFDRIQESLFTQYVIETLSGPPLIELQKNEEEEERIANEVKKKFSGNQKSPRVGKSPLVSRLLSKEGENKAITVDSLHKMNPKNVSAWRMKRLINMIRHGALTTLDEQIQGSNLEDDKGNQIRSELEAKLAARNIFRNVSKPGSKFIYLEDIVRFMPEDEAMKALSLFEGASESNRISKSCLKNWVVNAFRERRALALTLNDTKTAVNRLHKMVDILVGIVVVVIWLLILRIRITKFLVLVSSQVVLVAFIFGNMCKTVFESIIFLFVIHPFDVGDRCEIDGVQMVVEEMNILTTVFLRYDNQKVVYPNSLLWTKSIGNYYRSPDMGDGIEFSIHISTPADKIALMKQRITSYVDGRKDQWHGAPMIIYKEMEGLNSFRMAVWPTHRMNHQDMGERWSRRSQLVEELTKICRELDIDHRLYPLDVNVRAMPPLPLPVSVRIPPSWTAPTGRS